MPGLPDAISHAVDKHLAGQWVEAAGIYRQIIELDMQPAQARYLLGVLAEKSGNPALSTELIQQALLPKNLDALAGLADHLAGRGQFEMAQTLHLRIAEAAPRSAAAWNNLGNFYRIWSKPDQACDAFERAIKVDPTFSPAHCNLGNALKDRGQIDQAIASFRRAVELTPSDPQIYSNLVYACGFSAAFGPGELLNQATAWADRFEKPLLELQTKHSADRDGSRKLRVGYVSMDFRNHVVGRNVLPILQNHDRERFEIHCFSTLAVADAMTLLFARVADHWHECGSLNDSELAEKIRSQQIDILVDLSLHMAGNRLLVFARRPAPVQITWAGYPGTTGLRSIDFRITDPQIDPVFDLPCNRPAQTDEFYSEKSIRLPHSFWCYRPMDGTPLVNPLPAVSAGFITFGCLNNFAKVTPAALRLWATVLIQTPQSRLLLLCPEGSARTNTLAFFASQQVQSARVQFVPMTLPENHMQRYHAIDICLDPLPYTGHTTTLDALWMGVPVVTLAGTTSLSRGSVTALTQVGLESLIAKSADQYVEITTSLASDINFLERLRMELRDQLRASPICDESQFTRSLEKAFRFCWRAKSETATEEKGFEPL